MEKDTRTLGERLSDCIAHFGGSWKFIIGAVIFLAIWVASNVFMIAAFDPYPFILLNLLLSLVAAFQAPFILMAQHRAEKKQDHAYRELFKQIIELEEQILDLIKIKEASNSLQDDNNNNSK